jgi:hypothetical protein
VKHRYVSRRQHAITFVAVRTVMYALRVGASNNMNRLWRLNSGACERCTAGIDCVSRTRGSSVGRLGIRDSIPVGGSIVKLSLQIIWKLRLSGHIDLVKVKLSP